MSASDDLLRGKAKDAAPEADKPTLLPHKEDLGGARESKNFISGMIGGNAPRELRQIPVKAIKASAQVRREFPEEAQRALMENIREQGGVIEPVIVNVNDGDGTYFLVAGERRLRATRDLMEEYEAADDAEMANQFAAIPAIVYQGLSPEQIHEMQLSENLLREDLTPFEEAWGLRDLLANRLQVEPSEVPSLLTRLEKEARSAANKSEDHDEQLRVVEETFASFSSVTWRTFTKERLHLFSLPPEVEAALLAGRITSAQADILVRLKDKDTDRLRKMRENLIEEIERGGMTLEGLAQAVKAVMKKPIAAREPEVQVANRVKRALTPKRILSLPADSRKRVRELLDELGALLEATEGKAAKVAAPAEASAEPAPATQADEAEPELEPAGA